MRVVMLLGVFALEKRIARVNVTMEYDIGGNIEDVQLKLAASKV